MVLLESNIHQSSKLYRSRVLLREWLLWWQHKSLKLEMSCCDSRLLKMSLIVVTTINDVYVSRSSSARPVLGNCIATHGILFTGSFVVVFFVGSLCL